MGKKVEPPGESAPMWIVSFADLVTLMMSFFVVLYALKQDGSPQKQLEVTAAIKNQFGYEPRIDSTDALDMAVWRIRGKPRPPMSAEMGRSSTKQESPEGLNPNVTTVRAGKQITSGGLIHFEPGSTTLDDQDNALLKKIADMVRGHNNVLFIKGHASADELALRPDDPAGMALSFRRATTVSDALAKLGIDARVLRPVACGAYEPLKVQSYDASSLKLNRRVEVFSTEATTSDFDPTNYVTIPETAPATQPTDSQPAAPPSH